MMLALDLTRAMASAPHTDLQRWHEVAARSHAADGQFVYAVTSTGVYCRPSCPSRRPRRDRVRYFESPGDAERAGFRACLRCRPSGARPVTMATRAVAQAAAYLRTHAARPIALAHLATRVGLSASHLQRVFTAHTGLSPRDFQAACRAERFRGALRAGHDVTRATYEAGYGSPSRVSAHKPTGRGVSPSTYRRGAPGVSLRYTVQGSPLGRLLVAWTRQGVCSVKIGPTDGPLVAALRREFPKAEIRSDRPDQWAHAIAEAIRQRPAVSPDVPLDVQGTAFQWLVWKALLRIPAGETRSYSALAADIGRPGAVRAVARACAANPVALAVPCHRVVPRSGGPGGYRWGTSRKAELLVREASSKPVGHG